MSDTISLEAQPRTTTGKQVKQLRVESLIPAVIYGPMLDTPVHIQIPERELRFSLREAGGTNLIEINLGKDKINVLVRDVQRAILTGELVHVDFYAVDLTVKITADVPISVVGDAPIVHSGEAMLITAITSIQVECLPNEIPQEVTLDISALNEIGVALTVADLAVPGNVTVLEDPDTTVVRTDYAMSPEIETEEEEEFEDEFASDEPEVIGRQREEEIEDEE
jgi:large subunit ribosomal protein L25